jgi:class 3 adenylate cyclase
LWTFTEYALSRRPTACWWAVTRDLVLGIVNRYEGHVGSTQGDGLLAVFGHPKAHENDVRRAVLAGWRSPRAVERLSDQGGRGMLPAGH